MEETAACALLKARFEAAGYRIEENIDFDEDGVRFELDGFDPDKRVGYEYVSSDAGDGWDVDDSVIAALAARRDKGELFVLVVDERDAPDPGALGAKADAFLAALPKDEPKKKPAPPKKKPAAKKKPASKKKKR
jgi:hypothetical protein